MLVHDDDVGIGGVAARPLGEAGFAVGAPRGARTFAHPDADRGPGARGRLEVELGAVAGDGCGGPRVDAEQLVGACRIGELVDPVKAELGTVGRGAPQLGETLTAHVVRAALQHRPTERHRTLGVDVRGEKRQVLARQLVLERLGGRGHHHLLARHHGRHEIGERLASTGSGLHEKVAPRLDGVGHRSRHSALTLADLAATGELQGDRVEGGERSVSENHRGRLPAAEISAAVSRPVESKR